MDADVLMPVDYSINWHYALGGPLGRCLFKSCHEDFVVDERLPFEPDGEGEHLFLLMEKKGENTDWVAGLLARYAGVRRQAVSYAGRKDRHGITRQWFCVSLPGMADPDWSGLESDSMRIIRQSRHRKKLKIGTLKANDFCITLRNIDVDPAVVNTRLEQISREGVPNYFGEQRFGRHGQNIEKAVDMLGGQLRVRRNKRSVYLSSARSWLFNRVLSEKVSEAVWNQYLSGDVLGFQDSNSLIFETPDDAMMARLDGGELSPTSPLWGGGLSKVADQVLAFESSITARYPQLSDGLERTGMLQERRVNRVIPQQMTWVWESSSEGDSLVLRFRLPKGCFATSVLRELFDYKGIYCRENNHVNHVNHEYQHL